MRPSDGRSENSNPERGDERAPADASRSRSGRRRAREAGAQPPSDRTANLRGVTVDQAQKLISLLLSAYPEVQPREETFPTYVRFLVDLDEAAVEVAIEELISVSTKMPTIAAIRRRVIEQELELPTAAEAWVAINDTTRTEELHELAKEARELLGGSWAIRTSGNPTVTRTQYLKVFEELRDKALYAANRRSRKGRSIGPAKL